MRLKRFSFSLLSLMLLGASQPGWADILHFHNGKVLRGDVHRVTGDLIHFKGGFGENTSIPRLHLTNRQDVLEMRFGGKKLFGEVVYIDKFQIELKTPTGIRTVNRMLVKNLVFGTPQMNLQEDHGVESANQQMNEQDRHIQPVSHQGAGSKYHNHPGESTAEPRLDLDFVP